MYWGDKPSSWHCCITSVVNQAPKYVEWERKGEGKAEREQVERISMFLYLFHQRNKYKNILQDQKERRGFTPKRRSMFQKQCEWKDLGLDAKWNFKSPQIMRSLLKTLQNREDGQIQSNKHLTSIGLCTSNDRY